MASNQTTNYGLNQWEATDQVLRTEFNADNQKIDGALAEKMGPLEYIGQVTANSTVSSLSLDLTNINWDQWSIVIALLSPVNTGSGITESYFSLIGSTNLTKSQLSASMTPVTGIRMVAMFPFHDAQREICAVFFPGGDLVHSTQPFQTLTSVYYGTNVSPKINAGTRIRLYGVR